MSEEKQIQNAEIIHDEYSILPYQPEGDAAIDVQISTAKKYPRNVTRAINNTRAIIVSSEAIARSCGYALPRDGKTIAGPSVHLAKILAQNWGNMRIEAKVTQITETQVVCQGIAWDLESNVAVKVEVRRRITTKAGKRFGEDMITVSGNAGNAIALRNAVFAVIPKGVVEEMYQESKHRIVGDLSDSTKLNAKRVKVIAEFKDSFDISESELMKILKVASVEKMSAETIGLAVGVWQSLMDGDTTKEQLLVKDSTAAAERVAFAPNQPTANVDAETGEVITVQELGSPAAKFVKLRDDITALNLKELTDKGRGLADCRALRVLLMDAGVSDVTLDGVTEYDLDKLCRYAPVEVILELSEKITNL